MIKARPRSRATGLDERANGHAFRPRARKAVASKRDQRAPRPAHGVGGSGGAVSSASDDDGGGSQRDARAERAIKHCASSFQTKLRASGIARPAHGGGGSGGAVSSATDDDGGGSQRAMREQLPN
jgi:hypothetical protein